MLAVYLLFSVACFFTVHGIAAGLTPCPRSLKAVFGATSLLHCLLNYYKHFMLFFKIIIIGAPICQPFETKIFIAIQRTLTALAHYTTTELQVLFANICSNYKFCLHF